MKKGTSRLGRQHGLSMPGKAFISMLLACLSPAMHAGEIAGTVTRSDNGQLITHGYVRFYNSSGNYLTLKAIDNSGHYSYTGVAAGNYFAVTDSTGFFDELWDNKPCAQGVCTITSGTQIIVGTGTTTANFALATGGAITGTVTATATGQPISDGYVKIYNGNGHYLGLAPIDNAGHYIYSGLAAGNYFVVTDSTGFFDELWDNKPCAQGACTIASGTPIIVGASGSTIANFSLATGGAITGTVTAAATGQPITHGYIKIHNSSGGYLGLASIDTAGHYTYNGLAAGNYFAVTYSTGYSDKLWDNKPCPDGNCTVTSGTPITVGASGATIANFSLASGGTIAGTVTQSVNGQPVTDGYVQIYDSSGSYVGLTGIDNAGHYAYSGLGVGSYFAVTDSTGFFDELWDNKPCAQSACTITSGTPIAVSGTATATANFALVTGGSIAGAVTVSGTGQAITDGYVKIHNSSGVYLGLAPIDSAGHYTYGGLAAGSYFAVTYQTGYLDELWDNKPCAQGTCTMTTGTPIVVTASGATTANFQLSGSTDLIFRNGFEAATQANLQVSIHVSAQPATAFIDVVCKAHPNRTQFSALTSVCLSFKTR